MSNSCTDGSLQALHVLTAQPRLVVGSFPHTVRFLSLTTLSQDLLNPWVAAFLLEDAHVASLLLELPHLEILILSGHPALTAVSITAIAGSHGVRLRQLSLARCSLLDSAAGAAAFCAETWPALGVFEAPGPLHFNALELTKLLGTSCSCIVQDATAGAGRIDGSLEPKAGNPHEQ